MPGTPPARFAYLGPAGTFCEAALRTLPAAATALLEPYKTVQSAMAAVRHGSADGAVVPFENSIEGSVSATLDDLAAGEPLRITREILLPVRFVVVAHPETALAEVTAIGTHPHAEAQCRHWLAEHLPQASVLLAPSTAEAAAAVSAAGSGGPAAPYNAAITAPLAAERYGLRILVDDVGDNPDAVTRFVLLSRPGPPPPPTGTDRSTLVAFIADDHPGALLEILTELAVRGVNLTRIESRPTGLGLGRYSFSIDCDGHIAEARVGAALSALHRICADLRFLGSYPRADRSPPTVRKGTGDADFADAAAWLAELRGT